MSGVHIPLIYEVTIELENVEIEQNYLSWLKTHLQEILTLDGFIEARLYRVASSPKPAWTVHYTVETRAKLDAYIQNHAPAMRAEGVSRFGNQVSLSRRILLPQS